MPFTQNVLYSQINATLNRFICNGILSNVNPTTTTNSSGTVATVNGIRLPSFLKYFGNCSGGNKVCANNEILNNNSNYCNLTIPNDVTVKINPAERTVIYVKDTLFLYGTINGSGANTSVSISNTTANHVGATASHFNFSDVSSGSNYPIGTGNSSFALSWTANQAPSTYYNGFDGSISKKAGSIVGGMHCEYTDLWGAPVNGEDLTVDDLQKLIHFGSNISGGNGLATACGTGTCQIIAYGGQGGAGLYILAKNIIFTGNILLNGGDGAYVVAPCQPAWQSASAGGGAGSCIISTNNIIQNSGNFQAKGGKAGYQPCGKRGGNGSLLIVKE